LLEYYKTFGHFSDLWRYWLTATAGKRESEVSLVVEVNFLTQKVGSIDQSRLDWSLGSSAA